MKRVIAVLVVTFWASVVPATQDVPTHAPVWPERAFESELDGKGVVLELSGDPRRYRSFQIPVFGDGPNAAEHAQRLLDRAGQTAFEVDAASVRAEGANSLVFRAPPADWMRDGENGERTLLFVSLQPEPYAIERTWMAYEPATTDDIDGLAIIVPGTFGYPPELYEKWSDDLRSRGWSVLRLLSQPSRFTERISVRIDGDGREQGRGFAERADDRTAECAFAVEHGARFIEQLDNRLVDKPRAILGFSGGAILAPGVVAREPDRYQTVILVAGGANAASISIDSTFMARFIRSVSFEFAGDDQAADRAAFEAGYLEHATLDGFHAAASFDQNTRVLVVDGTVDRAVPFVSSQLMVDRLRAAGIEPDRRSYPVNHVMLFMALNESLQQINDWIDDPNSTELALPPGEEARARP
ncbi:MAG: alpha/beta hydrolase family protein [Phycisphaerales bacterium]